MPAHHPVSLHVSDQQKLPYVCATLLEVQRKASIAAFTLPHKSIQKTGDIELLGFKVPCETQIVATLYSIHRDPGLFPDPNKLHPERFLDDYQAFQPSKYVVPFSIGNVKFVNYDCILTHKSLE